MRRARPGQVNGSLLDRFTLVHFAAGVLVGAAGVPWWGVLMLGIGWELVENPAKAVVPELFPNPTFDTATNAIGDLVAFVLGAGVARFVRFYTREIIRGRDAAAAAVATFNGRLAA